MDMRLFGVLNGFSLLLLLWFICGGCGRGVFGQSINVLDLTRIRGTWIYDSNSCYLENRNIDYDYSNLIWFGESDGITYNSDYDFDTFILQVEYEILSHDHASSHVGILFRSQSVLSSESIVYGGKQYFVGLKPDTNQIVFSKIDNDWNLLYSKDFNVTYGKRYVIKIESKYVSPNYYYDVYVDGVEIWSNIELNDYINGTIGLRSHRSISKYHSITLTSTEPTTPPTTLPSIPPTQPSIQPTTGPTVFDACVNGNGYVEFGFYIYHLPELVSNDGWERIETLQDLLDINSEFISFFNNNGGLPVLRDFGKVGANCCFAFGANDTYLTISSSSGSSINDYVYPGREDGSYCNRIYYEGDKYQFYRPDNSFKKLLTLNENYIFGETNVCQNDWNPTLYKRYC